MQRARIFVKPRGRFIIIAVMKDLYVKDLEDLIEKPIESVFVVAKAEARHRKTGERYLVVVLSDRTGKIEGTVFDNVEVLEPILTRGQVVRIRGQVGLYQNAPRVRIQAASVVEEYDMTDLIPSSPHDIPSMFYEVQSLLNTLQNPYLRELVAVLFEDTEFVEKLKKAPAAIRYHHNYMGGLLEHTLNLLRLANVVAATYPSVDRDLLLVGALLHDIGKIDEYTLFPVIEQTDEGRLLGHILMGYERVQKAMDRVRERKGDFPEELRLRLLHLILSHHGELAKGSPVEPRTLEAQILHFLDYLDSRVWMFEEAAQHPTEPGARWSEYWKPLSRSVFIGGMEENSPASSPDFHMDLSEPPRPSSSSEEGPTSHPSDKEGLFG